MQKRQPIFLVLHSCYIVDADLSTFEHDRIVLFFLQLKRREGNPGRLTQDRRRSPGSKISTLEYRRKIPCDSEVVQFSNPITEWKRMVPNSESKGRGRGGVKSLKPRPSKGSVMEDLFQLSQNLCADRAENHEGHWHNRDIHFPFEDNYSAGFSDWAWLHYLWLHTGDTAKDNSTSVRSNILSLLRHVHPFTHFAHLLGRRLFHLPNLASGAEHLSPWASSRCLPASLAMLAHSSSPSSSSPIS